MLSEMGTVEFHTGAEAALAASEFEASATMDRYNDSGWIGDHRNSNHVTEWRHGHPNTPRMTEIFFSPSPDASSVFPLKWSWGATTASNPVTIEITSQLVRLHIFAGQALHGVWDGNTSVWRKFNTGYWRILSWQ